VSAYIYLIPPAHSRIYRKQCYSNQNNGKVDSKYTLWQAVSDFSVFFFSNENHSFYGKLLKERDTHTHV